MHLHSATTLILALFTTSFIGVDGQSRSERDVAEERDDVSPDLMYNLIEEDDLRNMYKALPKNRHGRLDNPTTKYALHRFFLKRSGWSIRGLEPRAESSNYTAGERWVPDVFEQLLDFHAGDRGLGLAQLAALATDVEKLIKQETSDRVDNAFHTQGVFKANSVSITEAKIVLQAYYEEFVGGDDSWMRSESWFAFQLENGQVLNAHGLVDIDVIERIANTVGEQFHLFQEQACRDLGRFLRRGPNHTPGRIRLSKFYSLEQYSHWEFVESREFLRDLGILDESDPSTAHVIIPNYIESLQNCEASTSIYSSCCSNQCDDLMGSLEAHVERDSVAPGIIADFVMTLSSPTVRTPRVLSQDMHRRLYEIADHHGGEVSIHGRLFAEWMHRAFPYECAYPHEVHTLNKQFSAEWASSVERIATATQSERNILIDQDACDINGCNETADITWTHNEEMFGSAVPRKVRAASHAPSTMFILILLVSLAIWRCKVLRLGCAWSKGCKEVASGVLDIISGLSMCGMQPELSGTSTSDMVDTRSVGLGC